MPGKRAEKKAGKKAEKKAEKKDARRNRRIPKLSGKEPMKRKLSLQDTGRSTGNCLFRDGKMQTVFCETSEIGRFFCNEYCFNLPSMVV